LKIVIASDSFKGCLPSLEVAESIKSGILEVLPNADVSCLAISDGGEGFVKSIIENCGGKIVSAEVCNPVGEKMSSFYGISEDGNTAFIESAAASGITLIPESLKNPMVTTSFGTGEMILCAITTGFRKIVIGLGGSATTDGGAGALQALGVKFLDETGNEIKRGGGSLCDLETIDTLDLDKRINDCEVLLVCDVNNPLFGKTGAADVYAEQKGATIEEIKILDDNLRHFAEKVNLFFNKDISTIPGGGAAGGLGAGLSSFLDADIKSGTNFLLEMINFREKIKDTDLVITGEGRLDKQTQFGKAPFRIAQICRRQNIPVAAVCGSVKAGTNTSVFNKVYQLTSCRITEEYAIKNVKELLRETGKQISIDLSCKGKETDV
jgi:glycerate 2-kinase